MMYLTRRYSFSASHRLHNPQLAAEQNERIYGKCNSPHGHGHNYALEITVAGVPHPATGMVVNLAELDDFVQRTILDRFDLAYLNDDRDAFRAAVPTTENLCRSIYHLLQTGFQTAPVERVRLEETSRNAFEYAGESEGE